MAQVRANGLRPAWVHAGSSSTRGQSGGGCGVAGGVGEERGRAGDGAVRDCAVWVLLAD